jgi:hypothetical protein
VSARSRLRLARIFLAIHRFSALQSWTIRDEAEYPDHAADPQRWHAGGDPALGSPARSRLLFNKFTAQGMVVPNGNASMSEFLWIVIIFFGVMLIAVLVSSPSPHARRERSRKLPRSANRGGS